MHYKLTLHCALLASELLKSVHTAEGWRLKEATLIEEGPGMVFKEYGPGMVLILILMMLLDHMVVTITGMN